MTCTSCAARIEKRLNGLDGVSASVNYAAEQAAVSFDPEHASLDDLIGAVKAAGYHAALPDASTGQQPSARSLLIRLWVAVVLSIPLALLAWDAQLRFYRLEMGFVGAGHPGRVLQRLAVSPRRGAERQASERDHGHAHLARHAGGLELVGRGVGDGHERGVVLRRGGADHDADPAR